MVAEADEVWTADMITDAQQWLKELLEHMDCDATCQAKADKKVLSLLLEKSCMATPEEERQMGQGLSNLIIQFLKKKHKKKLRGFHLVVSSKQHAASQPKP